EKDIQTISIIVFSERCELKDITLTSDNLYVCNRDQISKVMRNAWGVFPDILSEEEIEQVYEKLLPLTNADEVLKKQHIDNIQERLENTEICPRCGGKLVLRTAKTGANAGKQFYGCSNYPKCRYIKNLE
ncbi:MAG: topoisomerase DNA-binding C4 zinc finger domain-containing protein, partial [Firmicutes bacterium]|nr:topoisomerase DNA-binding C4 zinc finger domain-containing protein [Bacillota bacterium]